MAEGGYKESEEWFHSNRRHCLTGPAILNWDKDGNCCLKRWFFNGEEYLYGDHPFQLFCKEHNLPEDYNEWPEEMKALFVAKYPNG